MSPRLPPVVTNWEIDTRTPAEQRRLMLLRIFPELFTEMFIEEKFVKVTKGLPKDSKLVRHAIDIEHDAIVFVIASKEFDVVPNGAIIPFFGEVWFTNITEPTEEQQQAMRTVVINRQVE